MARTNQPARIPAIAVWALRIGGAVAVTCGGLLSFVALYRLALENGWPPYAAWALPVAVDTLAATAFIVAMAVPREHTAATVAHWCAGIALIMTVGCNIEYHALLPATYWSVGHVFLVATGAAPALVVELIIVMQMYLGDGATLAAQDTTATNRTTTPKRDHATDAATGTQRPAVAPATAHAAPKPEPATKTAADAPPPELPAAEERQASDDTILTLLAVHGRADKARGVKGVTGPMVAEALGIHRSNGALRLASVLRRIDGGTLQIPAAREPADADPADEPERELVTAG